MISCFVSDLDGTLLTKDTTLSPKTISAIQYLKSINITIVIASGRADYEILDIIKPLELDQYERAYMISYNGAKITHIPSKKIIKESFLSRKNVLEVVTFLNEFSKHVHAYGKNHVYISEKESQVKNPHTGTTPFIFVDMKNWAIQDSIYKVLVYDEPIVLEQLKVNLPLKFNDQFTIFKSHMRLLEFVSLNGSKGDSLIDLSAYLGIPLEEVCAFGDEENDIKMLQVAGIGIAMENAKEEVKKAADLVTLSNDFDGAAEAIFELFK